MRKEKAFVRCVCCYWLVEEVLRVTIISMCIEYIYIYIPIREFDLVRGGRGEIYLDVLGIFIYICSGIIIITILMIPYSCRISIKNQYL